MQIEITVPLTLKDAANTLAACKGPGGPAELRTFPSPRFTKGGVQYCWCQVTVSDAWLQGMQQPVQRPEWDAGNQLDIAAAQAVLSNALILASIPEALPALNRMVVYLGTGLPQALGMTAIPEE
jgi:hypothetical protein